MIIDVGFCQVKLVFIYETPENKVFVSF